MSFRKFFTIALGVILTLLVSLTLMATGGRVSDFEALNRMKQEPEKAPNIQYPKIDRKGRSIPKFDFLVVMPDCTSCSTFRKTSASYMADRPQSIFLILTPDLKDLSGMINQAHYFVVQYDAKSKFANLTPGIYPR